MFTVINKYGKAAVVDIGTVFGAVFLVGSGSVLWNVTFQTLIQSHFSESVISEIHCLWGSSVFRKYSKFNVDYRNAEKNWEKVSCFWDNSIWIGCIKLSLLRREYLSAALKVLTNCLKILHSTKRNFLQLILVHSDQ